MTNADDDRDMNEVLGSVTNVLMFSLSAAEKIQTQRWNSFVLNTAS